MDLTKAMGIAASGMKAQGTRLRIVAENLANADSLPTRPGESPYRRKVVDFKDVLDPKLGTDVVEVKDIRPDMAAFGSKYDPTHPAANKNGYVETPNVNPLIEMMDMREAQRSYEANLDVIQTSKTMIQQTLNILQ